MKFPLNALSNISDCSPHEEAERLYWETALVQQLESHTRMLSTWSLSSIEAWDSPTIRMVKYKMPPTEDVCDTPTTLRREVWNSSNPSMIDVSTALRAVSGPEAMSSDSNSLDVEDLDQSSLTVLEPPGIIKLQAVFRSRKVRAKIRSALFASRYQDDELDEMLGQENFDFDDAMDLGGYEEYMAPVGLKGGWHSGTKHSSSAQIQEHIENSQQGAWAVGQSGCHNGRGSRSGSQDNLITDETQSSFSTQGVSLVYGDHRRRKSAHRDGSTDSNNGHVRDDGSSGYRENPNIGFSATAPVEWQSRPSTSMTDTSSLSGASSRAHTETDHSTNRSHAVRTGMDARNGIYHPGIADTSESSDRTQKIGNQADEWGLSDPKVLQAMLKRNKRMK